MFEISARATFPYRAITYIAVDWPNRPRRVVDALQGKPSETRWRLVSHDERAQTSRVDLEPITGRSHQLRIHLKALGHPILGDDLYGSVSSAPRLLLHATKLSFPMPGTDEWQSFESPPDF